MDSFTISNSLSKGSVYESESIYNAYREDAQSRLAGDERPVAISNEQIQKGDVILETYRVEGETIHGGMGSVWRVHHNSWNTDLAMKRPQPRFFAEGSERRKEEFIAECEHWINLGLHPNIVSCYYVREIGGVPTIFSEWMDGGSLKDAIQSGRLYEGTADEVQARILDVAIQAARGLAYSHEKGLIHQDVKPGNILLTKGWDAKVADFGLAKARSQLNDSDRPLSSGYTLQYCPREQAEGARAEAWMDVYAWAATVLEMLLRHRPWQTGAEAKDCVPEHLPGDVGVLIMRCLSGKQRDFAGVEEALVEACGSYDRPEPKAAAETSDSLNNRALSYLDLGKPDEAEKLWRQALRTDATGFYARYNYELWRWAHGRISDVAFHDAIFRLEVQCKAAALARARISLCRRVDLGEAERCLEALELRWSVDDEVEDGLLRSLSSWKRALQAMPALPADCFSEASRQAEAMFLSKGFAEAFPRLTARQGAPFRILETGTGRILREMNVQTAFNTGDEAEEWLEGYMPEGGALLHAQYMFRRCIALPDPEIEFPYELAMVQDHRQRRMAEEQAIRDYDAARAAWAAGRVVESARILDRCLNRGTLMLHEPSMALWTELGRYFSKKALIAAAPTDMPASPPQSVADPSKVCQRDGDVFNQGWACVSCDGITELRLTCSRLVARENLNNNTDAEFTYCVTATDVATGKTVFQIDPFFQCEEDDDLRPFSRYQIRMDMPGKLTLWSQYEAPRQYDILDMPGATVRIALPGGYDLVNCSDGVEIGGVLHADRFTDYRPLFNAEIIPCRDHNYRLIYEYDLSRENTDHSGMDTVSLSNTLSKGSVIESDSIYVGDVDDVPGSLSNEQIRKGDVITQTYTVVDDAIHGGMGSVWRVHHRRWNTDLAMKRPQPRFFAEGSARRKEEFVAECEHWIDLGLHPNIVSCYYVREIGGVPTIFSEWMDGGSLKDAIQSGRLYEGTEDEVQARILDVAIQAARGLAYSHEKGLIHQDVKPGNILLTKGWDAKVADFGLAKARSQLNDGDRPLSSGYTLQYCPKEQAEGAPAEAWMDVYAWALTVIEMYAGERPWQTGAEVGRSVDALMKTCRIPIPGELRIVLSGAVNRAYSAFARITQRMERIYAKACGSGYGRPDPEAARDIADSMNNRALSFIELGQRDRALETLDAAVLQDGTNTRCQYNRALLRWNMNLIPYEEFAAIVKKYDDGSPEFAAVREQVEKIADPDSRKGAVRGKPTCTYVTDTEHDIIEKMEDGVLFEVDGQRYVAPGDALLSVSPDGKRALSCRGDWNRTGYYLTDLDSGNSIHVARTWCSGAVWLKPPRFCDAEGTVITTQKRFEGVYVFDAASGRGLIFVKASNGPDAYTDGEEALESFYSDGRIWISSNAERELPSRNPRIDAEPDYLLSKIKSYGEQTERRSVLARTYAAAKRAFERGRFDETRAMLEPFVQSKDIFLMPESLELWGDLSRFYEKDKLLTVLPQQREGRGEYAPDLAFRHPETLLPPGTKCENNCDYGENECYTVTIHYDYRSYENYNNSFDIDSDWDLTAYERGSGRMIFDAYLMGDSQTDETYWDTTLYVGFLDKASMWYTKAHMQGYDIIDLRKKKPKFYLADGSIVQNGEDGLHIGELIFDDVYEGCESLLDADVLRGRKRDYRLIYTYGDQRKDVGTSEAGDASGDRSVSVANDGDASRETPAEAAATDADIPKACSNADFVSGKVAVWDYEIQGEPIHTGMGCVFRVHKNSENIDLAMVRPEPARGSGEVARRARLRDAFSGWQALGRHENIVACREAVDVGGMPTAFCEWIDGESLLGAIRDGSLYAGSLEEAQAHVLGVAMQAARALKHIHSGGIVHCDVKPANILIDGNGTAKLNDFGLSVRSGADKPAPGYTPAYCPGEQIEGRSAKPWMDVYAWALTVLEMLIGHCPWQTGTQAAERFDEYIASCRVPPPGNLATLLRLCLRWKVSDGAVIVKELEAIERAACVPKAPPHEEEPVRDEPPAGERVPAQEDAAGRLSLKSEEEREQAKPRFFERIKKAFYGKKWECMQGNHPWNGCVCPVCGAERHDFRVHRVNEIENGGCCWSITDPCTGPHCGTPCDNYYPGREGRTETTWKCARCGIEKTENG